MGSAPIRWWQRQLDLCTIGIMATFGWEKALGDAGELYWWEERVARRRRAVWHSAQPVMA